MSSGEALSSPLPVAFCPACEASVVTYRDLSSAGDLVVCCLSCGAALGEVGEVSEILAGEELLHDLGYQVSPVKPKGGAGGCGSGGSCGCSSKKKSAPPAPPTRNFSA